MDALPIRLKPGDDLRRALEAAVVLIAFLDTWDFGRERDALTRYDELALRRRAAAPGTVS